MGVLTVVTIPCLLWNPGEFIRDVFLAQFSQPFRVDSISWLVVWYREFDQNRQQQ